MKAIHKKLLIGGLLMAGGVGYLAYSSLSSGWVYYMPVAEYAAQPKFHTQRVKLSGKVAAEGLTSSPASLTASFRLAGGEASVPVVYRGVVPDLFEAGRDVVVEGKMDSGGVFQADMLMTKCASKYESQKSEPGKAHPDDIQRSGA